ncbi:MAG: DNA mismatch repair endonuclease MutL [Endomicrobium sp.]|jgi:DNA mismatch repair protein MutL|nr:DNA mismatch repair endonuclease MutL [Endomicrobium sp.]
MSINILSRETINKIAAGEVIERPLNVVKELVENSLDAFASSVIIEIENAGKKFIRVVDDGLGMNRKDLLLSILKHATSKIKNFDDLSYIHSFGFRGEALSSIATVSNFIIKTRKRGEALGWKLSSIGGQNIKVFPWAGYEGTITEVENLFFNTPARYKFLKNDSNEKAKIINSLEEIALSNQNITFRLFSEKKYIFSTIKTNNRINRISDILGRDFTKNIRNVKIDYSKISLDIYFIDHNNLLSSRKYQYLFVNARPVNYPKFMIHCIYHAYREFISIGKHPGILIYVTIDPSEIDVNIHPTKREIKFANENKIYDIIFKILKNELMSRSYFKINTNLSISDNCTVTTNNLKYDVSKFVPMYTENCSTDKHTSISSIKQIEIISENFENNMKIIGQIFDTYIIVESYECLYIFDQHATAERVKYELYLSQLKKQNIKIQQMLIPENFDIPYSGSEVLKANISILNELGINVQEFGKNSFRVTAYPALLGNISIGQTIKIIISDIERNDKNIIEIHQKKDKIIRLACHTSIRSGDKISFVEAKKLINDLFKCECPFTCPHGRPLVYKISLNEFEKFFKRK